MRRDFNLIIEILEYFEAREEVSVVQDLQLPGRDDRVVAYHIRRMYEAGLLDAEAVTSSTTQTRLIDVWPFGLTWEGHEFLDAMRQQSVKSKIKSRIGNDLGGIPFVVLKQLAVAYAKESFGL